MSGTIVSTRVFNAPRQMVYEAFADPRQVVERWGPHGFNTTSPGDGSKARTASWRIVMHGPDGTSYPNEMTFTAVVPNERIELGPGSAAKKAPSRCTSTGPSPGKTKLTVRV